MGITCKPNHHPLRAQWITRICRFLIFKTIWWSSLCSWWVFPTRLKRTALFKLGIFFRGKKNWSKHLCFVSQAVYIIGGFLLDVWLWKTFFWIPSLISAKKSKALESPFPGLVVGLDLFDPTPPNDAWDDTYAKLQGRVLLLIQEMQLISWHGNKYPTIRRISCMLGGEGFLPSTINKTKKKLKNFKRLQIPCSMIRILNTSEMFQFCFFGPSILAR